jgi:hypothetical protein
MTKFVRFAHALTIYAMKLPIIDMVKNLWLNPLKI